MRHELRQIVAVKEVIKRVLLGEQLSSAIAGVEREMKYGDDRVRDLYRDNVRDLILDVAQELELLMLLKKIPPQDVAGRVERILSGLEKRKLAQPRITKR